MRDIDQQLTLGWRALPMGGVDGDEAEDVGNIHVEMDTKAPQYDEYETTGNEYNGNDNVNVNIAEDEFVISLRNIHIGLLYIMLL